jgi:hypothetical protein
MRELGALALELGHRFAEDEELRVDERFERRKNIIADCGVLRAQIQQRNRHEKKRR